MAEVVDVLVWDLAANFRPLGRGLGLATKKVQGFVKALGPVGVGLAAISAAMVIVGIKSAKMAAELDMALAEVNTLIPATAQEMEFLRKEIVAMSTRVPEPPAQLTKALYQAISAGARDTTEALQIVEQASKAATAGLTDTETAVDAITTVLNAYQMSAREAERVSDVFFKTVEQGKLKFEDIASNIGNVATSAALTGVSIEELSAAMATMTKFGVNAAESTTALNRFLIGLTSATADQKAAAKKLGIEYSITGLKQKGLVGFMREMLAATNGNIDALATINPNIRAARAAFILAGKGASTFEEIMVETTDAAGSTDQAFSEMMGTAQNLSAVLKNKLAAVFYELGEPILRQLVIPTLQLLNAIIPNTGGAAEDAATKVRRLATEFSELEQSGRNLVTYLKVIEAASRGDFATVGQLLNPASRGQEESTNLRGLQDAIEAADPSQLLAARNALAVRISMAQDGALRDRLRSAFEIANEEFISVRDAIVDQAYAALAEQASVNPLDGLTEGAKTAKEKIDELKEEIDELFADGVTDADMMASAIGQLGDLELAGLQTGLRQLDEAFAAIERVRSEGPLQFLDVVDADTDRVARDLGLIGENADDAADGLRAVAMQVKKVVDKGGDLDDVFDILEDAGITLPDLADAFPEIADAVLNLSLYGTQAGDAVMKLTGHLTVAVRAATELAAAFGLVGDSIPALANQGSLVIEGVAGAMKGISALNEGVEGASIGGVLGPIGAAVGGLAGIISGLMSSGPSPEALRRMEIEEQNTDALRKLSESLDALREMMFNLPGRVGEAIGRLDKAFQEGFNRALPDSGGFFGGMFEGLSMPDTIRDLQDELDAMGFTFTDLQDAARRAGINIEDLEKVWEGALEGQTEFGGELIGAKNQWDQLVDAIGLGVTDLFETVTGRLESARRSIDLFDIEDPLEQIAKFVDVLEKSNVDLTDAEFDKLRAGDEDLIRELVAELETGTGRFAEGFAALGEFSPNDFLSLLSEIEGLGDSVADAVEEGASTSFQTVNQITMEQADKIIGSLSTQTFYLRKIAETVARKVLAPPPVVEDDFTELLTGIEALGDSVAESAQEVEAPVVDVAPPEVSVGDTEVKVEGPKVFVDEPDITVAAPEVVVEPAEFTVVAPDVAFAPEIEVAQPEVSVTSEVDVKAPEVNVAPEIDIAPEVSVGGPEIEVSPPDVTVDQPPIEVTVPNVTVEPTPIEVMAPDVKVEPTPIEVSPPNVTVEPTPVDISPPNVTVDQSIELPEVRPEPVEVRPEPVEVRPEPVMLDELVRLAAILEPDPITAALDRAMAMFDPAPNQPLLDRALSALTLSPVPLETPDRETMDTIAFRDLTGALTALRDTINDWNPQIIVAESGDRQTRTRLDESLGYLYDRVKAGAGLPGVRY